MKTTFDKKLLIEVLSIQSKSKDDKAMMDYLRNKVKFIAKNAIITEDTYGNIYVTKGKSKLYPCLVSHTDTVHKIHKDYKVYEQNNILFAFSATEGGQVGIGGDDKNGIFICLSALSDLENCKLVFFRDEEVGCLGSKVADMKFFDDCTIVCQADRRNHEGFVTKAGSVELSSSKFLEHITSILDDHHYKPCTGSVTDVMTLKQRGLGVCAFNIECAYYNPHSDGEIVHIENLEDCYETIMEIIEATKSKRWIHEYTAPVVKKGNYMPKFNYHPGWKDNYGYREPYNYTDFYDGEIPFSLTNERKDIINHRKTELLSNIEKDLITDNPKDVNAYLNEKSEVKVEDLEENPWEGNLENEDLSEQIQLWEEVMICKREYDSAIEDFQEYLNEKVEKEGRI